MPIGVTDRGESLIPDVVVAISSIIYRQTNGQMYETCKSMDSIRARRLQVVESGSTCDVPEEVAVVSGETGRPYLTSFGDGDAGFRENAQPDSDDEGETLHTPQEGHGRVLLFPTSNSSGLQHSKRVP